MRKNTLAPNFNEPCLYHATGYNHWNEVENQE